MPHRSNLLLNKFEPGLLNELAPHLSIVHLKHGEVLGETHRAVRPVYFPHGGIISCVVELRDGGAIETGMIGNDGAWGASQALAGNLSLSPVVMQVAGTASVMEAGRIRILAKERPAFRGLLVKYEQFLLSQVQQTAACNAVHGVQARSCKWFLRMHDLIGPCLPLTQESLAQMIGVRRSTISQVAGELQKAGMISYKRGHIHIVDLEQVRTCACECDHDVRSHYQRIFHSIDKISLSVEDRRGVRPHDQVRLQPLRAYQNLDPHQKIAG